jgi:hypothetical protein
MNAANFCFKGGSMSWGILIRWRPVTLLVLVLAIALVGSASIAVAAPANGQTVLSGPPAPTKATPAMVAAGDPSGPYYSVQPIKLSDGLQTVYLPLVLKNYQPPDGWTPIVSTDFEGAWPGAWIVSDESNTDGGEYYWGKRDCRAYAGSYSGWSVGGGAQGSGLGCGANYPNNVASWMVYGPFSLSNTTAADLRFKLWLNSEPDSDGVCRFASIDGYDFWGTCSAGNTTGWVDKTLDLANVYTLGNLLGQSNVWVAIYFDSNTANTYAEGGYVDNIVLRKCLAGETCRVAVSGMSPGDGQVVESAAHVVIPK